jgi:hypothetical protein
VINKKILGVIGLISIIGVGVNHFLQDKTIKSIDSFHEVEGLFEQLDENALCVFDVDDTLLSNIDESFQAMHALSWKMSLLKAMLTITHPRALLSKQRMRYLKSIIYQSRRFDYIEPDIVETIKQLQNRGVRCIALTAVETGEFGKIPLLEQWRYNHLQEMGFHLSFDEDKPRFEINDDCFKGDLPLFYRGILCTENYSKGSVLKAYLKKINVKPSRVIFFDDHAKHVASVKWSMNDAGIACDSFVYRGALKKNLPDFDFWLLWRRLTHLIEHEEWLAV